MHEIGRREPHARILDGDAYNAEKKRLEKEHRAIIDAGDPDPPLIDEEELWTRMAGGRKIGRVYRRRVVPAYSYPRLIGNVNDDDIATGPPDLREQTNMGSQSQEVDQLKNTVSEMYMFMQRMQSNGSSVGTNTQHDDEFDYI
ncbi:hypothetical protein PIB30_086455 [Stylosanthes scabra]|uniref:Uncharacterized protein n=1 Tax=Stylosanthes scabra TaxID=79078 RepID=A0ABU6ZRY5_9FABA|nr:hypothetical protein [Stylosanthes scabra]